MTSELVLEAISAIKAGDKDRARKLLVEAIRHDNKDDEAWYVLAAVVPEKEQKIECLERALKNNPQNEKVKRALAKYKPPTPKFFTRKKVKIGGVIGLIALLATCGLTILGLIINGNETPTSTPLVQSQYQEATLSPSAPPTLEQPTPTFTNIPPNNTPLPTETKEEVKPVGFACVPSSSPISGKVIHVVDGDTIDVLIGDEEFSVRYIGVDTPEINEALGNQASLFNSNLVNGKQVDLYRDVSETDKYGRLLFYVFVGDTFVNYELVHNGYALAKDYPPDTVCSDTFHEAANIAEQNALGLWSSVPVDTPTPKPVSPPSPGNVPSSCTCKPPDLDCADFGSHNKAQACYEYCLSLGKGDYYRLDGDSDGDACESLP